MPASSPWTRSGPARRRCPPAAVRRERAARLPGVSAGERDTAAPRARSRAGRRPAAAPGRRPAGRPSTERVRARPPDACPRRHRTSGTHRATVLGGSPSPPTPGDLTRTASVRHSSYKGRSRAVHGDDRGRQPARGARCLTAGASAHAGARKRKQRPSRPKSTRTLKTRSEGYPLPRIRRPCGTRTHNQWIKSPLLCQLS